MNDNMGEASAEETTIGLAGLRFLTEGGDEISYTPEPDLTGKFRESSNFT